MEDIAGVLLVLANRRMGGKIGILLHRVKVTNGRRSWPLVD